MRMVLDASVALSWCFPDEGDEYTQRILEMQNSGGAVVPTIWPLEIANALIVAERKKRIEPSEADRFISLLLELGFRVDAATSTQALGEIRSLARAHGLSAYDAAYLELAIREGLPLATSDDALKRAARKTGVALA
jgi:predicted nucleic acid-binding protein